MAVFPFYGSLWVVAALSSWLPAAYQVRQRVSLCPAALDRNKTRGGKRCGEARAEGMQRRSRVRQRAGLWTCGTSVRSRGGGCWGGICSERSRRSCWRDRGCRWTTARLLTRSQNAAAEADIRGVQMDRQANTSRRRRSSGKDGERYLLTPSPTQRHSQKQSKRWQWWHRWKRMIRRWGQCASDAEKVHCYRHLLRSGCRYTTWNLGSMG